MALCTDDFTSSIVFFIAANSVDICTTFFDSAATLIFTLAEFPIEMVQRSQRNFTLPFSTIDCAVAFVRL